MTCFKQIIMIIWKYMYIAILQITCQFFQYSILTDSFKYCMHESKYNVTNGISSNIELSLTILSVNNVLSYQVIYNYIGH